MKLLRATEHRPLNVARLSIEQRHAIARAAAHWKSINGTAGELLTFAGVDGSQLLPTQYVGVISTGDVCLEIYPKLDREMLRDDQITDDDAPLVMRQLIWMMHVSGSLDLIETGSALQKQQPSRFIDVLAWLLGKNLHRELTTGVIRHYIAMADDLRAVRGKVDLPRQLTRNWDRLDKIACRWDEFSPDSGLNRVLKAACGVLKSLTTHQQAVRLLTDCLGMLEEVADARPADALASARTFPWSRAAERFRPVFDFARKILEGVSQDTLAGETHTFSWLVDMNQLFEDFVAAAVRAHFKVPVGTQKVIGTLFRVSPGGIEQKPDLLWRDQQGRNWIGDAKYKAIDASLPWRLCLDPNDVRQLTTYGGLIAANTSSPRLVIFYPCAGDSIRTKTATTWNGLRFFLSPVRLNEREDLGTALSLPEALNDPNV